MSGDANVPNDEEEVDDAALPPFKLFSNLNLHATMDAISEVSFSKANNNILMVTSWDGNVDIYNAVNGDRLSNFGRLPSAILSGVWNDETMICVGGLDMNVRVRDIGGGGGGNMTAAGEYSILGTHDKPIRKVCYSNKLFISGSWDGSICTWDPRKKGKVSQMMASSRVFALDVFDNIIVSGNADGNITLFDMRMPNAPFVMRQSSLGHQIRCVRIFDRGTGLISGSIEGRVAVENVQVTDESQPIKRFTFKCHRNSEKEIYPVNVLCKHPQNETKFLSGGGDGTVCCWDAGTKEKDFELPKFSESIASISCSNNAEFLAVACSYGFEKGDIQGKTPVVSLFKMNF